MNKQITTILIAVVLAGGGGFYGGMKYGQNQRPGPGNFANMTDQRQGNFQRGMIANSGFTVGEVISKDASSITLKLQDGGSKIILISESTPVMQSVSGSANDIKIGEQITVTGSANSDGSISADSIRIGEAVFRARQ